MAEREEDRGEVWNWLWVGVEKAKKAVQVAVEGAWGLGQSLPSEAWGPQLPTSTPLAPALLEAPQNLCQGLLAPPAIFGG